MLLAFFIFLHLEKIFGRLYLQLHFLFLQLYVFYLFYGLIDIYDLILV